MNFPELDQSDLSSEESIPEDRADTFTEYDSSDSRTTLNISTKSKDVEFSTSTVTTIYECLTTDACRFCIFDLAIKLKTNDQYDIGGTYYYENNELKPEMWFYCTTSICPQNNCILNIFVTCRKIGLALIGISDANTFYIKKIVNGFPARCIELPKLLCWKPVKSCVKDESFHLKSYCFSMDNLDALHEHTFSIPIKIITNISCVISKETLQRIKIAHRLTNIFKRGEDTDFALEATSGKSYDVHKILLAAHSSVLRNLMENSMANAFLSLPIGDNEMEQFLEYIYTGCVANISSSLCWSVLIELAEKFKVVNLFRFIEYSITQMISINNAVDIAVLSEKYKLDTIQTTVFKFIRRHPEVLETDGWKNLNDVVLTKKLFKETQTQTQV